MRVPHRSPRKKILAASRTLWVGTYFQTKVIIIALHLQLSLLSICHLAQWPSLFEHYEETWPYFHEIDIILYPAVLPDLTFCFAILGRMSVVTTILLK